MATPLCDLPAIRRALDAYVTPGTVAELRLFTGHGPTMSGYFTDLDVMAQDARIDRLMAEVVAAAARRNREMGRS